jgi:CDP-2,3-bis-(O-geranylgeranyl)-sn-glycerol synthase
MTFLFILKCVYLILPAIIANISPILFKNHFKFLVVPIDFNKKLRGKPILGSHKTFRGFFVGIIGSIIFSYLQLFLYNYRLFRDISFINYSEINILLFGFLIGFGVLIGDALKSLLKRRLNIKPGNPFIPLDQLDSIIGMLIFIYPFYYKYIQFTVIIVVIPLWFFGHILITRIGYYTGMRKEKW